MSKFSIKKRHQARVYAMQAIYSWRVSGNSLKEVEALFLAEQNNSKFDTDYFSQILKHTSQGQEHLYESLAPCLNNRSIDELDPIEFSIIMLAMVELKFLPDTPFKVVINEAIEIAKEFGAAESHEFVNAVLDKTADKLAKAN